jgi:hypothetical protein
MLALEENLIKEYMNFQANKKYDKDTIEKLFKYLQKFTIGKFQKESLGIQDEIVKSLAGKAMFNFKSCDSIDKLVSLTRLKVVLSKDKVEYPYINIFNDEIDIRFSATYKKNVPRDKAKKHIKKLIENVDTINIYDRYISSINKKGYNFWKEHNIKVLDCILPRKKLNINIYCDKNSNQTLNNDLKTIYNDWNIQEYPWTYSMHDRYIVTEKIEILSSGFLNIDSTNKDFTYVVKVKE